MWFAEETEDGTAGPWVDLSDGRAGVGGRVVQLAPSQQLRVSTRKTEMPGSPQRLPPRQRRRLAALRSAVGGAEAAASAVALYSSEILERARAGELKQRAIPLTRASDPPGTDKLGLTVAERDFFQEHGFLVKRGLLPRPALDEYVDTLWSVLSTEQPSVARADRATHVDPHRRWHATEGPSQTEDGRPTARNWPMTFTGAGDWNWHALGSDPGWLSATSAHPNVLHMVEALIGGPVKIPTRNRGIYCMFPHDDPGVLGPHHDWHPFDLGGMAYISAVAPYSGGTTLWPGSHLRLQAKLPNEQASGFYANADYLAERDAIIETVSTEIESD